MSVFKTIVNNPAANFLCLLLLKAMIIFLIAIKNFEFKRPYTYTTNQLLIEFLISMILVYADKVKLVSMDLNHFGEIARLFKYGALGR